MARTAEPFQPEIDSKNLNTDKNFLTFMYLYIGTMTGMWCVGMSQLVTLVELILKTCIIGNFLAKARTSSEDDKGHI